MSKQVIVVMILLFFSTAGMLLGVIQKEQKNQTVNIVDCFPWEKVCELEVGGEKLMLSFSNQPQPLKPFDVSVVSNAELMAMRVDMEAMDMGENNYQWQKTAQGWVSRVILPVCVTGRADWLMTIKTQQGNAVIRFYTH